MFLCHGFPLRHLLWHSNLTFRERGYSKNFESVFSRCAPPTQTSKRTILIRRGQHPALQSHLRHQERGRTTAPSSEAKRERAPAMQNLLVPEQVPPKLSRAAGSAPAFLVGQAFASGGGYDRGKTSSLFLAQCSHDDSFFFSTFDASSIYKQRKGDAEIMNPRTLSIRRGDLDRRAG